MFTTVCSAAVYGLQAYLVLVEDAGIKTKMIHLKESPSVNIANGSTRMK
jgi:hypothetical protein